MLYLRLGYSVFIEWGYDKFLTNKGSIENTGPTLIDKKFFQDIYDSSDYTKWIPLIEEKRQETDGNYDGIFGTVSNFSWSFENDGTYNIKLEIISLGDIIESLKVNLPSVYASQGDSFLGKKYAQLLENSTGGNEAKDNFYNGLYKGLKESIEDWYTRCKEGWSGMSTLPIENLDYIYSQLALSGAGGANGAFFPGLNFGLTYDSYNFTQWYSKIKDTLGTDHEFYNNNGELYTNEETVKVTKDNYYRVEQKDLRNAIEYAIAAYYYWDWDVPRLGNGAKPRNWQLGTDNARCFKPWNALNIKDTNSKVERVDFEDSNGDNADYVKIRYNRYPFPYFKNGEKQLNKSFTIKFKATDKEGSSSGFDGKYFDLRYIDAGVAYNFWQQKVEKNEVAGSRNMLIDTYTKDCVTAADKWKTILESTWTKEDFNTVKMGVLDTPASDIFNNTEKLAGSPAKWGISLEYIQQKVYEYFTDGVGQKMIILLVNQVHMTEQLQQIHLIF